MTNLLKLYFICLVVFCTIDFFWTGFIAKNWYQRELGYLLADSIQWIPVVLFYLLYAGGLLLFAVLPALEAASWRLALLYGAALGLISYAAYDLTNLATIRNWPVMLAVSDIFWGSFVSASTSYIVFFLAQRLRM